jgi:hypothetical protein
VAPKIFLGSGTKLSRLFNAPCNKGETASAINLKVVPSLSIFQEISEIAMGGQELRPNALLIPPVTIISEHVRDNLRREEISVAKLSQLLRLNNP